MIDKIFAKIRVASTAAIEHNRDRISAIKLRIAGKGAERKEKIKELKGYADECNQFFNDTTYQHTQKFLDGCEKEMIDSLINISVSAKHKEELTFDIIRVGAQIELLRLLKNKPLRVVKQLEELNKKAGV